MGIVTLLIVLSIIALAALISVMWLGGLVANLRDRVLELELQPPRTSTAVMYVLRQDVDALFRRTAKLSGQVHSLAKHQDIKWVEGGKGMWVTK